MLDRPISERLLAAMQRRGAYLCNEEETEKLINMEAELHKRIIGQEDGITAVSKAIRRTRAGLKDPKRPSGSFIFLLVTIGVPILMPLVIIADCLSNGIEFLLSVMPAFSSADSASLPDMSIFLRSISIRCSDASAGGRFWTMAGV